MRQLFIFLIFFIAFIFQISVLPHFLIFEFSPNILLVVAILFAFFDMDYWELMISSFVVGLLASMYSGIPFGIILLSFVLTIVFINFLAYNFLGRASLPVVAIGTAIGSGIYCFVYFVLFRMYKFFELSEISGPNTEQFVRFILFSVALNSLAVVVLYSPLKKFFNIVDRR